MRKIWVAALLALGVVACREPDGPMGGTTGGALLVESDPAGGTISIDGRVTTRVTPDTLRGVAGLRTVRVALDTFGLTYSYTAQVVVSGTQLTRIMGPLMARCTQEVNTCARPFFDEHVVGNQRFGTNALGPLFLASGSGGGLYWPANANNSYLSTGTPVFGALLNDQPVSLGVYDTEFFVGRPAPSIQIGAGGTFVLAQRAWIAPPPGAAQLLVPRGLEIRERVAASPAVDGVILVELTFRNISTDVLYRLLDPASESGWTYQNAYIGLALDPDIGNAEDDWLSYDEALATVYAYDAAFQEASFSPHQTSPALVGLRVMRAPPGTTVRLNGYANSGSSSRDWHAGTTSQASGYGMLSGTSVYTPDDPRAMIGHLPPTAGDVRIFATAGPLRLAPGEEAVVLLAVALATPAAGTYTSGTVVAPGDPGDANRAIHRAAALLRGRLEAAEQLRPLLGQ